MSKLALYDALFTQLDAECPEIKTVKLWNSQLDNQDTEEAVGYPAVYLEMSDIDWEDRTRGTQEGYLTITAHVVTENYKTDDRQFLTIVDAVFQCLHRYGEDFFTPLLRVAERQDTDHDQLTAWEIDFTTRIYDCQDDTINNQTMTTLGPNPLTITKDLDIDNDIIRTGDGDFS